MARIDFTKAFFCVVVQVIKDFFCVDLNIAFTETKVLFSFENFNFAPNHRVT